jgi:hypothetical protein
MDEPEKQRNGQIKTVTGYDPPASPPPPVRKSVLARLFDKVKTTVGTKWQTLKDSFYKWLDG